MRDLIPLEELGSTPTPENVTQYMESRGFRSKVVGTSVQGRDLTIYECQLVFEDTEPALQAHQNNINEQQRELPTILFLSLVHGNEVMGLVSLLALANSLSTGKVACVGNNDTERNRVPVGNVVFFPMVNIDGYMRNLECAAGYHRGNMANPGCNTSSGFRCLGDKELAVMGVDLNRNFPDWETVDPETFDVCTTNYPGPLPFSEPETRAIRQVVEARNVVTSLSFHSLRQQGRGNPLLIHPFAADRDMNLMPTKDREMFTTWGQALNVNGVFTVGTAAQAIKYTATGTCLDWLYRTHHVMGFVVEVVPVCRTRWCPPTPRLYQAANFYGAVSRRLVDLVVYGHVVEDKELVSPVFFQEEFVSEKLVLIETGNVKKVVLIETDNDDYYLDSSEYFVWFLPYWSLIAAFLGWTWKARISSNGKRRQQGKLKDIVADDVELQNPTSSVE